MFTFEMILVKKKCLHLDHPNPNSDITLKKKILKKNDSLMVLAKYMFRLQCTVQERYPILLSLLKKNIVNNTELMPANDIITFVCEELNCKTPST